MKSTLAGAAAAALLLLSLTPQTAKADATFVLDNPNITGAAGTTVGWGFTASSDIHHMTIVNVDLLPGASIGTFADMLAIRGTFEVGPTPSPSVTTHEAFNNTLGTGVASFAINPGTPVGSIFFGTLFVIYDLYNVSPNHDPLYDPFNDAHLFSAGNIFEIPVSVQVVNAPPPPPPPAVPEPSTYTAMLLAAGAFAALKRRQQRKAHEE